MPMSFWVVVHRLSLLPQNEVKEYTRQFSTPVLQRYSIIKTSLERRISISFEYYFSSKYRTDEEQVEAMEDWALSDDAELTLAQNLVRLGREVYYEVLENPAILFERVTDFDRLPDSLQTENYDWLVFTDVLEERGIQMGCDYFKIVDLSMADVPITDDTKLRIDTEIRDSARFVSLERLTSLSQEKPMARQRTKVEFWDMIDQVARLDSAGRLNYFRKIDICDLEEYKDTIDRLSEEFYDAIDTYLAKRFRASVDDIEAFGLGGDELMYFADYVIRHGRQVFNDVAKSPGMILDRYRSEQEMPEEFISGNGFLDELEEALEEREESCGDEPFPEVSRRMTRREEIQYGNDDFWSIVDRISRYPKDSSQTIRYLEQFTNDQLEHTAAKFFDLRKPLKQVVDEYLERRLSVRLLASDTDIENLLDYIISRGKQKYEQTLQNVADVLEPYIIQRQIPSDVLQWQGFLIVPILKVLETRQGRRKTPSPAKKSLSLSVRGEQMPLSPSLRRLLHLTRSSSPSSSCPPIRRRK